MDWISWIGGGAGIVAFIKVGIDVFAARSNRNVVDISNMEKMLDNEMERYEKLEKRFEIMETKVQGHENKINDFEKVVNTAWRCPLPQKNQDCPVIAEYEKRVLCEECYKED